MYNCEPPSEELCHIYENLNGVPDKLVETAVSAQKQADLDRLCKAFVGDRGGYANVRNMDTAAGETLTGDMI